jgi:hypothetical protein
MLSLAKRRSSLHFNNLEVSAFNGQRQLGNRKLQAGISLPWRIEKGEEALKEAPFAPRRREAENGP